MEASTHPFAHVLVLEGQHDDEYHEEVEVHQVDPDVHVFRVRIVQLVDQEHFDEEHREGNEELPAVGEVFDPSVGIWVCVKVSDYDNLVQNDEHGEHY